MSLLLEITLKISVLVLCALAATWLLRTQSAAARHWVLAASIGCAAAMPALNLVAPSWHMLLPATSVPRTIVDQISLSQPASDIDRGPGASVRPPSQPQARITAGRVLGRIWITGAAVSLLVLLVGFARLAWLASRSQRTVSGRWVEAADAIARDYGLRRPVLLLQSDHPTLLVTWGWLRPRVLLPAAARDWPADRVRIVLGHELAHIRRGDWGAQLAAELLRSIYWFNPLVWMASRRLRQESEHACDDAVLRLGVPSHEYASHLVALARALKNRHTWLPAPAMARPSSLEGRISAMLNAHLNRNPITGPARVATLIVMLSVALPIAGLGASAQTAFAAFSGSVFDQMNGVLPAASIVLTNEQTNAKHQVDTNREGHFEFVGLPPGTYRLEIQLPGFANLRRRVTLAGQDVQQDITMQIGSLTETITVRDSDDRNDYPSSDMRGARRANPPCGAAAPAGTITIGGNIRAPRKLRDVRPIFPRNVQDAKAEEFVGLEARIGPDGFVNDVKVIGSPNPAFASAASEAVRQWEFDSTLLNCVPVDVMMTVNVMFKSR
jgi:beta-lactamase regulating signal transducer with metallopeptidase domain